MACVLEVSRSVRELRIESQTEIRLEPGVEPHTESHAELHAELRSAELAVPTHDPSVSVEVHHSSILPVELSPSNDTQEPRPRTPSSVDATTPNNLNESYSAFGNHDSRHSTTPLIQRPQPLGHQETLTSTSQSIVLPLYTAAQVPQSKSSGWRRFWPATTPENTHRNRFSKTSTSLTSPHPSHRHPTVKAVATQSPPAPSSVDSSSTPASSLVFSLPSLTSTRTSVDADTIFLPISSSKMYLFCEKTQLYVGKLRELPLPVDMESEWRDTMYLRLLGDLRCILQSLPSKRSRAKTIVEPELRLVGEPDAQTDLVELRPTVVIRCGCESYRTAIDDAVKDLGYLHAFSKGVVLVHRKAPKQASRPSSFASSSSTSLPAGHNTELVELARPSTASACGISMRYTSCAGMTVRENLCIIGGLIKINNTVYGLTTGHSVAIMPDESISDTDSEAESDAETEIETSSATSPVSSCEGLAGEELDGFSTRIWNESAHRIYGARDPVQWVSASLGPFNYLNHISHQIPYSTELPEASDFALVELGEDIQNLPNTYTSSSLPGLDIATTTWTVDTISTEETAGPVSVVCSPTDVRPAHLLEGEYGYLDRHAFFSTRKVQTMHPLGGLFLGVL
jgi:hypothetical protein